VPIPHARALALAGPLFDICVTVVVPHDAPVIKVDAGMDRLV